MAAANQPPSPQGQRIDPEKLTFVWGMEPVPMSDTPANFFVTGGVASGKTIILRLLMQSALSAHLSFFSLIKGAEPQPCGRGQKSGARF